MARPVVAAVLTFLSGLFVIVGGLVFALVGTVLALLGHGSVVFLLGLVVGLLLLLDAALMIAAPRAHLLWGGLAIALAVVSIAVAFGGFLVGLVLGLLGGFLALRWRPLEPPVITVNARVVPPPAP